PGAVTPAHRTGRPSCTLGDATSGHAKTTRARGKFHQNQTQRGSRRHNAPEARNARLAAAEGEPRHNGKKRSTNLLAVLFALVVGGGVIVADHVKGPLFHDVAYCLNDGGAQTTRMCTGRVPP